MKQYFSTFVDIKLFWVYFFVQVGLYVPGGTAVLPSTALMLGIPAQVAGCREIVLATPPKADGTVSPEILYIAKKIGASKILLAGRKKIICEGALTC